MSFYRHSADVVVAIRPLDPLYCPFLMLATYNFDIVRLTLDCVRVP